MSRPATHAGSWYSDDTRTLKSQLLGYLQATGIAGEQGANIIVSPHAGYRYCGQTMAHAYASLDLTGVSRIFIMGPSHHVYFKNKVLVSGFDSLETPLGPLKVDRELADELIASRHFAEMDPGVDMDEHSIEMQFSMLAQTLQWRNVPLESVKVIPLMVSHNSKEIDWQIGGKLGQFLTPGTVFIISSDFCHWGRRFGYTGYVGSQDELEDAMSQETEIEMLTSRSKLSHHQLDIWKSIELLDRAAMDVLESPGDKYDDWKKYLEVTGNTICGARPIALMLAILAQTRDAAFHFPAYSQSSHVRDLHDSSVSYGSGFATM
ncbi:hypothetical protein ZYGR_0AZ00460 [Zygosaccharomyces rouxii]|uniref:Uncharacterized protein n=1 Tax=Zygosaccharomyces rouxii TaxID=4956 RepID=A0A1Q3AJP9_ZYGRO|nr:hypothetical protein ZYGR_0AZ00460 [Zygosaccharomyces rouxii]